MDDKTNTQYYMFKLEVDKGILINLIKEAVQEVLGLQLNHKVKAEEIPISSEAAAAFLHIKLATLYGRTSRRELPFHKRGKANFFYESELNDWIKGGKVKTTKEIQADVDKYISSKENRKYHGK